MSASQAELEVILQRIPYARFLGVRMELHGDEMTGVLHYGEHLIGNPSLPALHGGVIGAFMEMTALLQLSIIETLSRQPRPVDVSIDYLRSGRPRDTYARALIKKVGRRIANVQVEAWQDERGAPIAAMHGHFLLTPRGIRAAI
jgi:acyl-coenzyme A thioesterase PaaI-like protein